MLHEMIHVVIKLDNVVEQKPKQQWHQYVPRNEPLFENVDLPEDGY
jgi:hypothetical protein